MKANMALNDLISGVLQEINKFGLCSEGYQQYRRIYDRIREFATTRNIDSFCDELFSGYLQTVEGRYATGAIGRSRRTHLKRTLLMLRDYAENGTIEWKPYVFDQQCDPVCQELLLQQSMFIENLRTLGRSRNTIESSRNSVRQFLQYLEDKGCHTLTAATIDMVPMFFQHLLASYSPTSLRTMASNIRSFLRFIEKEDLLRAVPSRCVRNRPIIPILSEKENDSLRSILQTRKIAFRDKAIILLAWQTGLRACDIVRMRLIDIDWINDTISIAQSKTGNPFRIPLSVNVGNTLSEYILTERPKTDNPYVFLRSKAPFGPLSGHSTCYRIVQNAFAYAGIRTNNERKGIHLLRHTAASRMLSIGVPITTISSMLGHSDKSSTDVYLSMDKVGMQKCALDLIEIPMSCGGLK